MYKKELSKMHDRVRFYCSKVQKFHEQIELIHKMDYIKVELIRLGGAQPFRLVVRDIRYQEELEALFDAPFHEIEFIYKGMLNARNKICHKYSHTQWEHSWQPQRIQHNERLTAFAMA